MQPNPHEPHTPEWWAHEERDAWVMRWTVIIGVVFAGGFVALILLALLGPFAVPVIGVGGWLAWRQLHRERFVGAEQGVQLRHASRQQRTIAAANELLRPLGLEVEIDRSFRADERDWLSADSADLVRSKSEALVANRLESIGADFCYEPVLSAGDGSTTHPDFLLVDGGRVIVLEYLGMLGDAKYRRTWERKQAWYREHGVLPEAEASPSALVVLATIDGEQLWGSPWEQRFAA